MTKTNRIQIEYELEFSAPFHCGTGVRSGLIDRSVMRDGGRYLYVPGSTIKGVVRELCEQLARFYEDSDDTMRARIASPHDKVIALKDLGAKPTLVTRIFGSQVRPGLLCFNDAQQTKGDKKQYGTREEPKLYQNMQTDLYTQVRLNRPTRTAVRGALYSSEFGVRKMVFQGSIVGGLECIPIRTEIDEIFSGKDDGPTYSLLLLLAGLYMIERLGGNKSTGKGECHCTITQLKINNTIITAEQRKSWLQRLNVLSYYSLMLQEEA
ncbi:MAG TPA: RAMP superfamily CRISPR-associated protein [Ktedonobacteraceae bacterium]|nr:RAMP superfamily CRISPR-associated protein [Ktedonobacteraceae bacterium]